MFAYGVATGSRDSAQHTVVWWGEMDGGNWNDPNSPVQMTVGAFAGVTALADYQCQPSSFTQDSNGTPATLTVAKYHEEFFQLAVQPEGNYAIGIANTFAFLMELSDLTAAQPFTPVPLYTSLYLSLLDASFTPRAVALESTWGAVAGWVQVSASKQWFCVVLLFNHTATTLNVTDRWQFAPNISSWQAGVQVGDASTFKPQHSLSLAVRSDGALLLGLQLYNSVHLFTARSGRLLWQGSKTLGAKAVGFGKAVSWASTGAAQVLYNQYTADYSARSRPPSSVQLYDVPAACAADRGRRGRTPTPVARLGVPQPDSAAGVLPYRRPPSPPARLLPVQPHRPRPLRLHTSSSSPPRPAQYQPTVSRVRRPAALPSRARITM